MCFQQLAVRTALHGLSAMQHQNRVRVDDGGEPVSNHHQRRMVAYGGQRLLDRLLGTRIYAGRGLVQNQHLRCFNQDARQRQELFLPHREIVALLA